MKVNPHGDRGRKHHPLMKVFCFDPASHSLASSSFGAGSDLTTDWLWKQFLVRASAMLLVHDVLLQDELADVAA
jgi:hypothetical protein